MINRRRRLIGNVIVLEKLFYLEIVMTKKALLILVTLLAAPLTVNAEDLRDAVREGNIERAKQLLETGADPDSFEKGQGIPIIVDAIESPAIVKLLIDHGANLKRRISFMGPGAGSGWRLGFQATALHYAVLKGNPRSVRLLINAGLDASATDSEGQTPLHIALLAENNRSGLELPYVEIVQLLLDNDTSLILADRENRTPHKLAEEIGSPKELIALIEAKQGEINARFRAVSMDAAKTSSVAKTR
ncbi:MAG: ankyrin repeat domain-containing protein [Pirellulaceae bacterium]